MYHILGIGEALIEFTERDDGSYAQSFAGDVLNTLFYASRLGVKTEFLSRFGRDSFTTSLESAMDRWHIGRGACSYSDDKNNGLYIVHHPEGTESKFTFFRDNSSARETFLFLRNEELARVIERSDVVLFSAIGLAVMRNISMLTTALRARTRAVVFFDTNVRRALWSDLEVLRGWLKELASVVDILSVSHADDRALFGERSCPDAVRYYRSLGYRNVIFRDGASDVLLSFGTEEIVVPTVEVPRVLDPTGAGDAFNAGFITAYLEGNDLFRSASVGCRAAAQVLLGKGGIVESFDPEFARAVA